MRHTLRLILLLVLTSRMHASTADEEAAMGTVQRFFAAMQNRDGAAIKAVWQAGSQYSYSAPSGNGVAVVQKTIEQLVAAVVADKDPWLERMWNPTIKVAGNQAVVWARYDFHLGNQFTHNGTDCYSLLKTADGWKIVGLVFTVEPGPATENPAGPPH